MLKYQNNYQLQAVNINFSLEKTPKNITDNGIIITTNITSKYKTTTK